MLDLFRAFTTQQDFFYDGAFIAKVQFQCFDSAAKSESYKNEVIKSNRRLCIIRCSGWVADTCVEILTVYLMLNASVKPPEKAEFSEDRQPWRCFSNGEIAQFSHETGDQNSIHLTDHPVVQGLFLLKEICATVETNDIEVKFTHPIYGGNPVFLERQGNRVQGLSDGAACFQAVFVPATTE